MSRLIHLEHLPISLFMREDLPFLISSFHCVHLAVMVCPFSFHRFTVFSFHRFTVFIWLLWSALSQFIVSLCSFGCYGLPFLISSFHCVHLAVMVGWMVCPFSTFTVFIWLLWSALSQFIVSLCSFGCYGLPFLISSFHCVHLAVMVGWKRILCIVQTSPFAVNLLKIWTRTASVNNNMYANNH